LSVMRTLIFSMFIAPFAGGLSDRSLAGRQARRAECGDVVAHRKARIATLGLGARRADSVLLRREFIAETFMSGHRWNFTWRILAPLALLIASFQASASSALPQITFEPAAPADGDAVTAVLPSQICAWTVGRGYQLIAINYVPAPCAMQAFTDRI